MVLVYGRVTEGITFNATETRLYVGNTGDHAITVCSVNHKDGILTDCNLTGPVFNGFGNIALSFNDNYAYVPNSNTNAVTKCDVDQSTGALVNCIDSNGTGFVGAASVTLR